MKRIAVTLLIGVLTIFIFLRAKNHTDKTTDLPGRLSHIKHINQLIHEGSLDSAENYCYFYNRLDSIDSRTFEEAMANIWLKRKLTGQAYDIVMKDVDYNLRLDGGGGAPFDMLYDYTFGPDVANDTLLEQMCINRAKDLYGAYPYSESTSGFKLILLNHKMLKLNAAYEYQSALLKNRNDSMSLFLSYQNNREEVINAFKSLLDNHKGLFSYNEIGMPENVQFSLISFMPELKDHEYFLPYFKTAFEKQQIGAPQYVTELVKIESFKNSDSLHMKQFEDSLMTQYYRNISLNQDIMTDTSLIIINQIWDSAGNKTIDTVVRSRLLIPKSPHPEIYKNFGEIK